MDLLKGKTLTICNLAIFIIVLFLLLHVLGYLETRVNSRESMSKSKENKQTEAVSMWFAIVFGSLFLLVSFFSKTDRT